MNVSLDSFWVAGAAVGSFQVEASGVSFCLV